MPAAFAGRLSRRVADVVPTGLVHAHRGTCGNSQVWEAHHRNCQHVPVLVTRQPVKAVRRVNVRESGLEARITADWGESTITFFDSQYVINRAWYRAGLPFLRLCRERAIVVRPEALKRRVCRDADDDVVLGTAKVAGADAILTGDEDLPVLRSFEGIAIWRPYQPAHVLRRPP